MIFSIKLHNNALLSSLILAASLAGTPTLAMEPLEVDPKFPSKFAVYQQEGATCPVICWDNLWVVRGMRQGQNGSIQMEAKNFVTKMQSYAWFLRRIRAYDRDHKDLRDAKGAYASYEQDLRKNGIKSNQRFTKDGTPIQKMDWNPLEKSCREAYTPYNIRVLQYHEERYLPILVRNGEQYLYDFKTRTAKKLDHYSDEQLKEKGFERDVYFYPDAKRKKFGSEASYYVAIDNTYDGKSAYFEYSRENFYYLGTYQHMLFACGLDQNNAPLTEASPHFAAYTEFHNKISSNPLNPWMAVNKEDLFEYHLTEIFKNSSDLKQKAMKSVNYYNDCWRFYQESFDFYDGPDPKTATKLSEKQTYLPGEDQCLAYYFSSQLRFLWAASISMDAVIAITELEDDLGEIEMSLFKNLSFLPMMPSVETIRKAARDKKYYIGEESFFGSWLAENTFSFLDTWNEIKPILMNRLIGKKDLATFYGHGCVISLDPELISLQYHEDKEMAFELGFEMWESLYDKGLRPFYQMPGTKDDLIRYED